MNPRHSAILLIEKDEITLEIYQRELSKSFTVLAFREIYGVLEALAAQDIQAVVIEPEINSGKGWLFVEDLRKLYPTSQMPVIVCTTRDPCSENLGKGISKYLTKPILPKTLREEILGILGQKEKQTKSL